jgi:hypothetical protein
MINVYDKGDLIRIPAEFINYLDVVADPGVVRFKFTKPDGVIITYVYLTDAELVKDATGNYHVDLSLTQAGDWHYVWLGTGAVESAQQGMFAVQGSVF